MVINRSTVSGLELAEIINASFNKVNADMQPLLFGGIPVQLTPDEFIISPDAVETSLLAINERKSTGPDNTELVTQGMRLRDLQSSSFYFQHICQPRNGTNFVRTLFLLLKYRSPCLPTPT